MQFWRKATRSVHIPMINSLEDTFESLGTSNKILFVFFAIICVISALGLVFILNATLRISVPAHGGSLTEGIVGSPRFINPILAISDPDRDLTSLVFSGLMRATPTGDYVPDLAQNYSLSSDGLTYTVTLRPSAVFSDGTPVTADDVVFTINKTQDASLKSPLRANWAGVSVQKVDEHTVTISLKQPYAPFIDNLTMGILPKHLWENVTDDEFPFSNLNAEPVGSGPYRVSRVSRASNGVPSSYDLEAFAKYAPGEVYLTNLSLHFYQSENALEDALRSGEIESASGLSPQNLSTLSGFHFIESPVNRVYGIFYNQNQSAVLRDKTVRTALNAAINKNDLVEKVLHGQGTAIDGPLPSDVDHGTTDATSSIDAARAMLSAAGWKPGPDGVLQKSTTSGKTTSTTRLAFSISTGDIPELRLAAQYVRTIWSALGASVDVKIFNQGDLSQNVIRPRNYDALLFGEVIGRSPDLYAFWASSERNDPGLNIALYANATVDTLLNQLRGTNDDAKQQALYGQIKDQLDKDVPALFLYTPNFVYSIPKDILGVQLGVIETPSDRFLSIGSWHREVDYVWPFFTSSR